MLIATCLSFVTVQVKYDKPSIGFLSITWNTDEQVKDSGINDTKDLPENKYNNASIDDVVYKRKTPEYGESISQQSSGSSKGNRHEPEQFSDVQRTLLMLPNDTVNSWSTTPPLSYQGLQNERVPVCKRGRLLLHAMNRSPFTVPQTSPITDATFR